jgi:hypothetical protein
MRRATARLKRMLQKMMIGFYGAEKREMVVCSLSCPRCGQLKMTIFKRILINPAGVLSNFYAST